MKKLIVIGVILVILLSTISVFAAYPTKSVTIVCPWGAGGGTDRVARFLAVELENEYGKPFVVINKTGGGGAVGHGAGAYAKPDGYTLTLVTLEIATMHWMGLTKLTYEDLDYVIQMNQDPSCVIVKADAPWDSITELLVDIAMHSGKYKFSGSGAGTIWDLSRIGLFDKVGIPTDYVTWIPTKGAAPSIVELLGGHVDVITCSAPEASAQLDSGEFRALAIMADERDSKFPDVPTLKELGIDWSSGTWRGVAVPKGTPKEVISSLHEKLLKIANSEKYKDFMSKNGFGIKIRNSEEFYNFAKEQNTTWEKVLRIGGYVK
jgi:tripartite-type tricarboxylate transporter receptor subunit TctC